MRVLRRPNAATACVTSPPKRFCLGVGGSGRKPIQSADPGRGAAWGSKGIAKLSKIREDEIETIKFGDGGLSIPRGSINPEILVLLGPTRHRKSMISLRKSEVFGYRASASGSEAALKAFRCSGWASGGVPGLILDSPGGPFGAFGRDFWAPRVHSELQFSDCAV